MISRILTFLSNVFLLPEEAPVLDELFVDKNPHYKEMMGEYWALDGTFIALDYTPHLKRELEAYKYFSKREKKDVFVPHLSECFRFFCLENIDRNAIICPVPLHFWSRLKRGYNHSELLASSLAKNEGENFIDLLAKSRHTKHQAQLSKSERMRNVRWSFIVRKSVREKLQGRDVILVDDVISTGSTANECAHILKKNGARKVFWVFLATGG